MSDETRRPGSGGAGNIPLGMRARNRTTVLGPERIDNLRTTMDRPASTESPSSGSVDSEPVDASALDIFGGDDSAGAAPDSQDAFQSLDEIFGTRHEDRSADSGSGSSLSDPFDFEPPPQTVSESAAGAPLAQPKVVRSTPVAPKHSNEDEVFDPFAAMQDEAEATPEAPQQQANGMDDLENMFGELGDIPVVESPVSGAPKIVRSGEVSAAHERVIVPPPPPPAAPIHVPQAVAMPVQTSQLQKEAERMPENRDAIYWKTESPLVGFLVTYDHDPKGSYVELRQGRLMVSNAREESGSCLVVLGESISPMHAIMRVGPAGIVQVLDQLSESGTRVKHMGQTEEEFLSGEKSSVSHGDIIFFGDRKFHVLLVVGEEEIE